MTEMTFELARSIAQDKAMKEMRAAGREKWSRTEWDTACAEMNRLCRKHNLIPYEAP
jgi:hypothetical protein